MKIASILILVFILMILLSIARASVITVSVPMQIKADVKSLSYEVNNGVLKVEAEVFNSGSVPFKARIRLNVLNATEFPIVWSQEKTLMPGDTKTFAVYWYAGNNTGTLDAVLRLYYGNEIVDRKFSFDVQASQQSEDVFEIKNFRVYDNCVKFKIISNKTLEDVVVNPSDYVISWIFEQKELKKLDARKKAEVTLRYDSPTWKVSKATIQIFTKDGKYFSSRSFELHKEEGIRKYIIMIIDKLGSIFGFSVCPYGN